ncbi:MAG TPA: hypothetical protein VLM40_14110, partial [Gemmata sp.]|nr:hypothetical protein [Gemmata sp.]
VWGVQELDEVARFWKHLYEEAASEFGYSVDPPHPRFSLEIQLSGFPLGQAESLSARLETSANVWQFPRSVIEFRGSETLAICTAKLFKFSEMPSGLGLHMLADAAFQGLTVKIELALIGGWLSIDLPMVLILVGELRRGEFLLKALWWSHAEDLPAVERVCRQRPMRGEQEWMRAFDRFRKTGFVPNAALRFFAPPTGPSYTKWLYTNLVNARFAPGRFPGLLVRFAVYFSLSVALPLLLLQYDHGKAGSWFWLIVLALPAPALLVLFIVNEALLLSTYCQTRRQYDKQFKRPPSLAIRSPEEPSSVDDDPAVKKYTADLLAQGFTLMGDVVDGAVAQPTALYRTFRLPDGETYFVLTCRFDQTWPGSIQFQGRTLLDDGGRVDTVAAENGRYLYLRYPVASGVLSRYAPRITNPIELCSIHKDTVAEFSRLTNLFPVRQLSFEKFALLQKAVIEGEYAYYCVHPYSLRDHLRWCLQWPRREQRG